MLYSVGDLLSYAILVIIGDSSYPMLSIKCNLVRNFCTFVCDYRSLSVQTRWLILLLNFVPLCGWFAILCDPSYPVLSIKCNLVYNFCSFDCVWRFLSVQTGWLMLLINSVPFCGWFAILCDPSYPMLSIKCVRDFCSFVWD